MPDCRSCQLARTDGISKRLGVMADQQLPFVFFGGISMAFLARTVPRFEFWTPAVPRFQI
jgi:hypothetical protein